MESNNVIFIKDQLPDLEEFVKVIGEISSFSVRLLTLKEFKTLKGIQPREISSLVLVMDPEFYEAVKADFNRFTQYHFRTIFKNIIFLYKDNSYLHDREVLQGKKFATYYSRQLDPRSLGTFFILYATTVFDKLLMEDRLNDYISNSFREVVYSELLVKKNKEILFLNEELERKNKIDNLTSLYNRKAVFDFLESERNRTMRDIWRIGQSHTMPPETQEDSQKHIFIHEPKGSLIDHFGIFALMMIDIDFFKKVNDTYGHLKGDEVLKVLAKLLQQDTILRTNDVAGRFGGEEFIVILPETNALNARGPAERLREAIKKHVFRSEEGAPFHITLSIGIAQFRPQDKTNDAIVNRADKALYYAKENGRDRVVIYEEVFKE